MSNDINLGGTIRPGTTDPVFEDTDGGGGYRVVTDVAARNAIASPYKKIGMFVGVQSDGKVYRLASTGPDVWIEFKPWNWVPTATKTATYTATYFETVNCNPTGGAFTVNLPTAVGHAGDQIKVKNKTPSNNAITLDPFGAETIDLATTRAMSSGFECVVLESDGANWSVV